jgi:hypothetical protein
MPNNSPPVLRSLEIAEAGVAYVDIGRTAVDSEALLENIFINKEHPKDSVDNSYLGVVGISHSDIPGTQQVIEEPEVAALQAKEPDFIEQQPEEKLETVSNKYIRSKPYKPTGDDPYPPNPALLAPS